MKKKVSMSSENHSKLVGHLHWLSKYLVAPEMILSDMPLVREVDGWFWVEPNTGEYISTRLDQFTVASLCQLAKPEAMTFWNIVSQLTTAYDEIAKIGMSMPMNKFASVYELLDLLCDAHKMIADEIQEAIQEASEKEGQAITGISEVLKSLSDNEAELRKVPDHSESLHGYTTRICNVRFKLWKHDAGTELIKALRLVKHPSIQKHFIGIFKTILRDVNPALSEVIGAINKPKIS